MKKLLPIVVSSAIIFAILFNGCGPDNSENVTKQKKASPLVGIDYAKKDTVSEILNITGEIAATRIARLSSATEGPVLSCRVREGDFVKKDDLLVRIGKDKAAFASLSSAETFLNKNKEEYKRIEQLVKIGAIPAEELDKISANLASSQANHAKALEETKNYQIYSPWNGVVSKAPIAVGDYVSVRSLLVELYDPGSLVVRFAVPEVRVPYIKNGMKIQTTLDAYPGQEFAAKITQVYRELDQITRTLTVEAKIIQELTLVPGMFARISIPVRSEYDAVTIPESAILITPQGDKIVYIVEDNKAKLRIVKTGIEYKHRVQILEGVEQGEKIIISGKENLSDGMSVRLSKKNN